MSSMQNLRGALTELDHAFGAAAYAKRPAAAEVRGSVGYEDSAAPPPGGDSATTVRPQSARPRASAAGGKMRCKHRPGKDLPWIDYDGAAGVQGEGLNGANVNGKKRAGSHDYGELLDEHLKKKRPERGERHAHEEINLMPSGEPMDAPTRNVAYLAAEQLKETTQSAVATIARIVALLGIDKALELLDKTERTEEAGGLFTAENQPRRRTKGGVFFFFVKQLTNRKEKAYIWPESVADPRKLFGKGLRPAAKRTSSR